MRYIKVKWLHDFDDEPVLLYSEVADDGYETRKVEVFRDSSANFADDIEATGNTVLGEGPVPPLEEIAAQEEFAPETVSQDEFEQIWMQVRNRCGGL